MNLICSYLYELLKTHLFLSNVFIILDTDQCSLYDNNVLHIYFELEVDTNSFQSVASPRLKL